MRGCRALPPRPAAAAAVALVYDDAASCLRAKEALHRTSTNARAPSYTQLFPTAADDAALAALLAEARRGGPPKRRLARSDPRLLERLGETAGDYVAAAPSDAWGTAHADVAATVRYAFKHFKRGIFVQVRDGRLRMFAPFANAHYRNPLRPGDVAAAAAAFPREPPPGEWYTDGCHVKTKANWRCNPPDWYYAEYRVLFDALIARHGDLLGDVDLVLNCANFPMLSRDGRCHPHDDLFDGACVPLDAPKRPCRVLSQWTQAEAHRDVRVPSGYDVQIATGKVFLGTASRTSACSAMFAPESGWPPPKGTPPPFAKRKDVVAWRGSLSTCSARPDSSCRVKASRLRGPAFDVAIVNPFADSVRKQRGVPWHATPPDVGTGAFLSRAAFLQCKYVLVLGGTVFNAALPYYLPQGSVVLAGGMRGYGAWYSPWLRAGEHYLAVDCDAPQAAFQAELEAIVASGRGREGAARMRRIVAGAAAFFERYITMDAMADYLAVVLSDA